MFWLLQDRRTDERLSSRWKQHLANLAWGETHKHNTTLFTWNLFKSKPIIRI